MNSNIPLLHTLHLPKQIIDHFDAGEQTIETLRSSREELIDYAVLIRPQFDRINRIISQLAALFILARAHGKFDRDVCAVVRCVEQAEESSSAIQGIAVVPQSAVPQHQHIKRAALLVRSVTREFLQSLRTPVLVDESIDRWTALLTRAHTLIRCASNRNLGLSPVDFNQGCCACHPMAQLAQTLKV